MTDVDVDALPLGQYLVLDVLAARWRAGDRAWTFPGRRAMRTVLDALTVKGLVTYKAGTVEKTFFAWLTEAGQAAVLKVDPPNRMTLEEAQSTLEAAGWRGPLEPGEWLIDAHSPTVVVSPGMQQWERSTVIYQLAQRTAPVVPGGRGGTYTFNLCRRDKALIVALLETALDEARHVEPFDAYPKDDHD